MQLVDKGGKGFFLNLIFVDTCLVDLTFLDLLLRAYQGKDLSYLADTLGTTFSEQQTHTNVDVFRMTDEPEQHGRCVVRLHPALFQVHYSFHHASLSNVSDVHSRLKSGVYRCRVINNYHCCLKTRDTHF